MNKQKLNKKIYLSYEIRITIYLALFTIFLLLIVLFSFKAFSLKTEDTINYNATGNIEYKVSLKDNDYFNENITNDNESQLIISKIIENIGLDFNYHFSSKEVANVDLEYSIIGKLIITNNDKSKSYYENEELLLDKQLLTVNNRAFTIKKHLDIDYNYYNQLANNFKLAYGVDATSEFIVYMKVNYLTKEDHNSDMMSITIPLTEKSIDLNIANNNLQSSSSITAKKGLIIVNKLYLIFDMFFAFIVVYVLLKILRLTGLSKQLNSYDKELKRIIKGYDRFIVETQTKPIYENKEVIKIDSFNELLDVRDNLKVPILHYVVTKHQKSIFYIKFQSDLYLYILKEVDLNKKS